MKCVITRTKKIPHHETCGVVPGNVPKLIGAYCYHHIHIKLIAI